MTNDEMIDVLIDAMTKLHEIEAGAKKLRIKIEALSYVIQLCGPRTFSAQMDLQRHMCRSSGGAIFPGICVGNYVRFLY